jgi:transposase
LGSQNLAQAWILGAISKKKLAKADLKAQEKWINDTLPKIEKEVESSGGVLLYEDEAIFRQSGTVNKTWALVGIGMEVKSEPGRTSVKTFGAINVTLEDEPRWHFRFAKTFNGCTFIGFLEQLIRRYPEQKVHLILDNIAYHKSPEVREWFAQHRKKIKPFYLPTYSPELNAAEYVWRATKRKATHNIYFPTKWSLRFKLFRRFNRYQGNPKSLRNTINCFALRRASN